MVGPSLRAFKKFQYAPRREVQQKLRDNSDPIYSRVDEVEEEIQPGVKVKNQKLVDTTPDHIKRVTEDNTAFLGEISDKMDERVKGTIGQFLTSPLARLSTQTYSDMVTSNSPTLRRIAATVFEDPAGLGRHQKTSAVLKEAYETRILSKVLPLQDILPKYGKATGDQYKIAGKGFAITPKGTQKFSREVRLEMIHRTHNEGKSLYENPKTPQEEMIKEAGDHIQAFSDEALLVSLGKKNLEDPDGLISVRGMDQARKIKGYFPHVYNGGHMRRLQERHGIKKEDMVQAQKRGFTELYYLP